MSGKRSKLLTTMFLSNGETQTRMEDAEHGIVNVENHGGFPIAAPVTPVTMVYGREASQGDEIERLNSRQRVSNLMCRELDPSPLDLESGDPENGYSGRKLQNTDLDSYGDAAFVTAGGKAVRAGINDRISTTLTIITVFVWLVAVVQWAGPGFLVALGIL